MEMYELFRENVYRIVDSSSKRDKLINEGFALVQTPFNVTEEEETTITEEETIETNAEDIYQNMTYQELQKLAKEKGIELKRDWKKHELIEAIEAIKVIGDVR